MPRHRYVALTVLCLLLAAPLLLHAQQGEPNVYIFVAEWRVSRAQWSDFNFNWEKYSRPTLEKYAADGTLMSWGNFSTVVHEEKGITHGFWFAAGSLAAIEKVRGELIKNPPSPVLSDSPHHDHLLRALIHRAGPGTSGSGYLFVSVTVVKPGHGEHWRQLWDKHVKPTYDELLANGTINSYEIDADIVHTENPGLRYVVVVTPSAEASDKVREAFAALNEKRGPEERRAIGAAFDEITVPEAHRDLFARITSYWHK